MARNIDALCERNHAAMDALGRLGVKYIPLRTALEMQDFIESGKKKFGWDDKTTVHEAVAEWLLADAN